MGGKGRGKQKRFCKIPQRYDGLNTKEICVCVCCTLAAVTVVFNIAATKQALLKEITAVPADKLCRNRCY